MGDCSEAEAGLKRALREQLLSVVDTAEAKLRTVSEAESEVPLLAGGWSRKQVVGHLIDSASNNHQRFVRAMIAGELVFPGYDQAGNVRVQAVQEADWPLLVSLWASYNRYLAYVIGRMPEESLGAECRIGEGEPVTLGFLLEDYLAHLLHHMVQLGV
jgi:hypothetical protein